MKKKHLPFEQFLKDDGAIFDYKVEKFGQGSASTKDFNFRYDFDELQIGVKSIFDRWENSVDFVCSPIPANHEDFEALKAALAKIMKEKRHVGKGDVDIWPFVRQMRQELRSAGQTVAKQKAHEEVYA